MSMRLAIGLLLVFGATALPGGKLSAEPVAADDTDLDTPLKELYADDPKTLAIILDYFDAHDDTYTDTSLKDIEHLVTNSLPEVDPRSESAGPEAIQEDKKAYIASALTWNPANSSASVGPDGRIVIPVCFASMMLAEDGIRQIARKAAESTWETQLGIDFTGWGQCGPDGIGIRIGFAAERSKSLTGIEAEIGRITNKQDQSDHLNNISMLLPSDVSWIPCTRKVHCTWAVTVHEFGHALGMLHEQDTPDGVPKLCSKKYPHQEISEAAKAHAFTKYDDKSIMTYCTSIYAGRKAAQPSDCDIAALRLVYGHPPGEYRQTKCKLTMG